MSRQRKRFVKKLEDFLNKHPEYLLSLTNSRFYTLPPGKRKIKVAISHLQADCKVDPVEQSDGYNILIHDEYANTIEAKKYATRKYLRLMSLYFWHELHHVQQKVGNKHTISGYRNSGVVGEMVVALMDIKADRTAVQLTGAFMGESEVGIAKLQSESLEDFPSQANQPAPSLWRKNRRYIANRIQYLCLKRRFCSEELANVHNFICATWNESTETGHFDFIATLFGSDMKSLGIARITVDEFSFLNSVTFPYESSSKKFRILDKLLLDILGRLHFGTSGAVSPASNWLKPTFQKS